MGLSVFLALTLGTALSRTAELILARRNAKVVRALGALEHGAGHYPLLVAFHAAWFCSLAGESWLRGYTGHRLSLFCLAAFLVLQPLRWWAILSLGPFWNTRILVVPGAALKRVGPYRYFRHPNYWIVGGEIFLLPAAFSCWLTAIWASCANLYLLMALRIPAEERALSGADPSP